jgi:hypothetical protein
MQGTTMILTLTHPLSPLVNGLQKGQLMALPGRRGARIESRRGAVWVTQDGDLHDVVLDAGEAHVLDRDAPVLIQALDAACVSVQSPTVVHGAAPMLARLWQRLRAAVGADPAGEAA